MVERPGAADFGGLHVFPGGKVDDGDADLEPYCTGLTDAEKEKVWDKIREGIPQIGIYETRTDRNIRVFRLRRLGAG